MQHSFSMNYPMILRFVNASAYNSSRCVDTSRNACVISLHLSGISVGGTVSSISCIFCLYASWSISLSGISVSSLSFDSAICKSASAIQLRSQRAFFCFASACSLSESSGSGVCVLPCQRDLFALSFPPFWCHPLQQYLECCHQHFFSLYIWQIGSFDVHPYVQRLAPRISSGHCHCIGIFDICGSCGY